MESKPRGLRIAFMHPTDVRAFFCHKNPPLATLPVDKVNQHAIKMATDTCAPNSLDDIQK